MQRRVNFGRSMKNNTPRLKMDGHFGPAIFIGYLSGSQEVLSMVCVSADSPTL
jgi:hypothetical protein